MPKSLRLWNGELITESELLRQLNDRDWEGIPRSRTMAHSLDAEVQAVRTRPPDGGPYPIVLGGCPGG